MNDKTKALGNGVRLPRPKIKVVKGNLTSCPRSAVKRKGKSHYWLHVEPCGNELRFDQRPSGRPTLYIEREGNIEVTYTYIVIYEPGLRYHIKPRGDGWEIIGIKDGNSTIWHRVVGGRRR